MYWQIAGVYGIKSICSLCISLGIGYGVLRLGKIQPQTLFKTLFYSLILGLFILSTYTALFYTRGQSILLGALGILIWAFLNRNISPKTTFQLPYKQLWWLIPIVLVCIGIELQIITLNGNQLYLPHYDGLYQSEMAKYMVRYGKEYYHYALPPSGTFPYHYPEIWLQAGFQQLWNGHELWTWQLITLPLLHIAMVFGFLAFTEHYGKTVKLQYILLSLFFLVFCGCFGFVHTLSHLSFWYDASPLALPKYTVIIIVLQLIVMASPKTRSFYVSLLPIFSILTTPAVMAGMLVYAVLRKRWIVFLNAVVVIVWIGIFYGLTQQKTLASMLTLGHWDMAFLSTQGYVLGILGISFLPILWGIFQWKSEREINITVLVMVLVAWLTWVVLYATYDSIQIFLLVVFPLLFVLSWFVYLTYAEHLFTKIILAITVVFSLYNVILYKKNYHRTAFDQAFSKTIAQYLYKENIPLRGAVWQDRDIHQKHLLRWEEKEFYVVGLFAEPWQTPILPNKTAMEKVKTYTQQSLLFKVVDKFERQLQIEVFLKRHNLRFLVFPKTIMLEPNLQIKVDKTFENETLRCVVFKPWVDVP